MRGEKPEHVQYTGSNLNYKVWCLKLNGRKIGQSDSHLQAYAQRDTLHESDPLLLSKFPSLLFARIIQCGRELKQTWFELESRDGV